jgi:hypothetical protein
LSRKYKTAKAALKTVQVAFKDLTGAVGNPLWIQEWEQLEVQAMERRGEAMMIYNVSPIQGISVYPLVCECTSDSWFHSSLTSWKES